MTLLLAAVAMLAGAAIIAFTQLLPVLRARKADRPSSFADMRSVVVDHTTKIVEHRSRGGLKQLLERSGSTLRTGEWVLLVLLGMFGLGSLSFFLRGPIAAGLVGILVPVIAVGLLRRKMHKRQSEFADQLPDLLQNLSSALRTGQSLPQAVAAVANDLNDPVGTELRRVVIENRVGRDLVDSFRALADRMDSVDFEWVVGAIDINQKTGGDLAIILRRLDSTIRARNHIAGTVKSLSAEGKASGAVLGLLPPLMMLALQFINPGFLDPLFTTSKGIVLLCFASAQVVIGSFWLSRLARFKF